MEVQKILFKTNGETEQFFPRSKKEADFFNGIHSAIRRGRHGGHELMAGVVGVMDDDDNVCANFMGTPDDALVLMLQGMCQEYIDYYCLKVRDPKAKEMLRTRMKQLVDAAVDGAAERAQRRDRLSKLEETTA